MAFNGIVAQRVRGLIPFTWYELSRSEQYGDDLIEQAIDIVEWTLFKTSLTALEESVLNLFVVDFIAKLVAIEIIPAAIELWMNQPIVVSATGTNETVSYEERIDALRKLREDFLKETREKAAEIDVILGTNRGPSLPLLNTIADPFLTPSPQEFPRPFVETDFT
jgi:hypothetical protein